MPELPEVEVVRAGLSGSAAGRRVQGVTVRVPALRWPIPADLPDVLGHRVHTRGPSAAGLAGRRAVFERI